MNKKQTLDKKQYDLHEQYFHYVLQKLYKSIKEFESAHNGSKKKYKRYKRKYSYTNYDRYRTQTLFYYSIICNIIGDETKNTISYTRLRKDLKEKSIGTLIDLSQDDQRLIAYFRNQRNWTSHFTTNEFHAHYKYKGLSKEEYEYVTHKYVDKELYIDLIERNAHSLNCMKRVLELAINDYKAFFGNEFIVTHSVIPIIGIEGLDQADDSYTNFKNKKYQSR